LPCPGWWRPTTVCPRVVETDHGAFVLINTYVPNAGGARAGRPRADFKLRFLQARRGPAPSLPSPL